MINDCLNTFSDTTRKDICYVDELKSNNIKGGLQFRVLSIFDNFYHNEIVSKDIICHDEKVCKIIYSVFMFFKPSTKFIPFNLCLQTL